MSTELRAIFDRYALNYGQPIHLPTPNDSDPDVHVLPLPFFELNASAQVFAHKTDLNGRPFRPYVGLLETGVANARAELFEGAHIVAFGLEFCVDLYVHFQCLMSHPGVFSGIGDSQNEEPRVAWNNGPGRYALTQLGKLRSGEMFGPVARNHLRRMIANRLYHWALRFVGFHELGHHLLGHTALLHETQSSRIDDDPETYRSEHSQLRRLLEHQADIHAMHRMATVAVIDSKAPWVAKDMLKQFVFEIFVAILHVMKLWSRGTEVSAGVVGTYPHPAIRFAGLIDCVRTRFAELRLDKTDERLWIDGVGLALTEDHLETIALQCRDPAVLWVDKWDDLRASFEALKKEFVELDVPARLRSHAISDAYDGAAMFN
jgi:hypothetical protein